MAGRTFICTPGQSLIPLGTQHDVCKCGHERLEHWMGGGNCGEEHKNRKPCEYFRPAPATAARADR